MTTLSCPWCAALASPSRFVDQMLTRLPSPSTFAGPTNATPTSPSIALLLPTHAKSDVKLLPLLVTDVSAGTASDPFHMAEAPAAANGAPLPAGDTDPTRKAALKGSGKMCPGKVSNARYAFFLSFPAYLTSAGACVHASGSRKTSRARPPSSIHSSRRFLLRREK
jgi:hypothetical protein